MKGEGKIAESILQLFKVSKEKFMPVESKFIFNTVTFNYKAGDNQLSLF